MNTFIKREYDYALRICAYLAGKFGQGLVPISRLSRSLLISRPFTTKIVYRLKNEKIITTVQGKDGGVYLSRSPDTTTIYDVLFAMGFDSKLNECLADGHQCPMEEICRLHSFFEQQENLLLKHFKNKKLSDVIMTDDELKSSVRQSLNL
ncbi:Rrf2 family transcriptional regulator [candidate division KSB1 bacterium]|nr:Rrf2 family transcriptional regulator [candidate division KSB1 bacterium]